MHPGARAPDWKLNSPGTRVALPMPDSSSRPAGVLLPLTEAYRQEVAAACPHPEIQGQDGLQLAGSPAG